MAQKYKILMYEKMHRQGTDLLAQKCDLVYAKSYEEKSLVEQAADVDGIVIRANGAVSRAVIEGAKKLKVIGRHGVGLETVDMAAAKERGVKVVYTPLANMESVAEHFVALALMLAKKIRLGDIALREGNWKARYELTGMELRGKTLGVLGCGRIGRQTARICRNGFDMRVLYYDVVGCPEVEEELNVSRVGKETLFSESDFISINLPLMPATHHFVNAGLLKLMKPTAFIVNMARGPIWKEDDLVSALKERRIGGAGSDVYETEPPRKDHPLFKMDNFVGTPHMSAHTEEAMIRMSMVAKDILAVLDGKEPEFPAA
ncbi:MAG: hydroxyacid dehydrogenase [Desulfobacteraceae bacterium]|nr:MAG: hydroxyacid dehydrogenase [Desulfobacteraceae bacterium]